MWRLKQTNGATASPASRNTRLGHVLVHRHRRAEHAGAHERQVGHAQQPLQRAVFAQGAVHDGKHHVDLRQRLLRLDGLQLLLLRARQQRHAATTAMQRNARRVVGMQQKAVRVVDVPLALLVDTDQHRLEALRVQRIQDVARRLQRDLVLGRFAAEDEADPNLAHCPLLPSPMDVARMPAAYALKEVLRRPQMTMRERCA